MKEVWKDIPGYEGMYQISNLGRVKSLGSTIREGWNLKEKILKLTKEPKGYLKVGLRKNGKIKTVRVHRLVAESFVANPENLPEVNHKDENKENNLADNLEWCTTKYNAGYGTKAKRAYQTMRKQGTCGFVWCKKSE